MRFADIGAAHCSTFRIELIETGNERGNTSVFTFLRNGCAVLTKKVETNGEQVFDYQFSLSQPLKMDGFSIDDYQGQLVTLFCSIDGGDTWSVAGSPNFRFTANGVRFLGNNLRQSHNNVSFDFRAKWPLFIEGPIFCLICSLGCACIAVCGSTDPSNGKSVFICFGVAVALNQFIAAVGFLALDIGRESFAPLSDFLVYGILVVVCARKESMFVDSLTCVGLLSLSCSAVQDFAIFQDFSFWGVSPPMQGIVFLFTGAGFAVIKECMLIRAFYAIRGDRANYDAEWARILADCKEMSALLKLDSLADQIASDCSTQEARQLNRVRVETTYQCQARPPLGECIFWWLVRSIHPSLAEGPSLLRCTSTVGTDSDRDKERDLCCMNSIPGSVDCLSPVQCLDQLYSQALGVVEILHTNCERWASRANGSLVSLERGESGVVDGQSMQQAARKWIQLRFLKSPQRAVIKVLTCYIGDTSRLMDVCRARILFDCVSDIASCLESMRAEPTVHIVRVKNLMATSHDSWGNAGFRVR